MRRRRWGGTPTAFVGATAVVTGGASGIGRALAIELVARGACVVLADIDGEGAERAARELVSAGTGGSATGCFLDVRDQAAFRSLVDDVAERGGLDLLFNNAGISIGGPSHELTSAHWDRIIDVNLRGVVNGVLAAYPRMVASGHGCIVNTASGAGLVAPPFVTAYAATKHAVVGLSTGLRPEAALHGVRVIALCPGSVETAILDRPPDGDLPTTASATVTAREYLRTVGQRPIAADRFATLALDQIARNRGVIVVPASAKSLWYLHRLSPRLMDPVGRAVASRVQRKLVRPRPQGSDQDRAAASPTTPATSTKPKASRLHER
jgi:NAD(P)-dependent dehydrogenase (short-subunit alcohol dehydrogenase family)